MDEVPLRAAVERRTRLRDALALLIVPLVLGGLHALPAPQRRELAFAYTEPTVLTAYTSHFVHLADWHLAVNLVAYVLLAGVAYLLSVASGTRRRFLIAWASFLLAVPFALSALNLAFVRPRIGYGFSGVNMAFFGYLAVALTGYLDARFEGLLSREQSPLFFFLGLGAIALLAVRTPVIRFGLAAAALLSAALYFRRIRSPVALVSSGRLSAVASRVGEFELGLIGLVVFLLWPLVAFRTGTVGEGAVLNIYTHLLGYSIGFMASYLTFYVTDSVD